MLDRGLWRRMTALALTASVAVVAGCAQDVGDIDRTSPEKVQKALFENDDEWYHRQVVVQTDMQGSVIFEALESNLKRIRWTITENVLYAHSTVELVGGLNEGFDDAQDRRLGAVAAFPIIAHFDVQRSYNPATGEPSNVIVENMSDRHWYERDYMRVDWSTNLIDGFWMMQNWLGSVSSARQRIPNENSFVDPDRTRITEDYIDTVTEYHYQPDVYACYTYGLDAVFNGCEGGRLRVRNAFLKIDPTPTYEPLQFTDQVEITRNGDPLGPVIYTTEVYDPSLGMMMEVECNQQTAEFLRRRNGSDFERNCRPATFDMFNRFGYFRTERCEFDRGFGCNDAGRKYYANRWNIWQTAFDANGNVIPMHQRTPKPITYFLNPEYPEWMFGPAQVVAAEWDKAFRGAAKLGLGVSDSQLDAILEENYGHTNMFRIVENSCHPGPLTAWKAANGAAQDADRKDVRKIFADAVGGNLDGEQLERALWGLSNKRRVQLCADLEWATENRPAGELFTWERFGDLRYSFFNWVESDVPWAGYGPSASDPLTGELINGSANFAGGYIRRASAYAADLIQFFNGELSETDVAFGTHVRRHMAERQASRSQALTPEGKRELAARTGFEPREISPTNFEGRPTVDQLDPFILENGLKRIAEEADRLSMTLHRSRDMDTRLIAFYEKPEVKAVLLRDPDTMMAVKALASHRYGNAFDEVAVHQAYLDFFAPRLAHARDERRSRFEAERNIFSREALLRSAETLVTYRGAADYFIGKPRAEIERYFMEGMFIGTQLHEIGHTVGLRHNFIASMDALNYHDEYWLIEKAVADGIITPDQRYSIQGELAQQISGRDDVTYLSQTEFQLASVMDYTGDLTGRFAGLGKYDLAAINFAYGEHIQQWSDEFDMPNLLFYETWLGDYTELPRIFSGQTYSGPARTPEDTRAGIEVMLNKREWVPFNQAISARRQGILTNTSNWQSNQLGPNRRPYIDRAVSYEFCTDDRRNAVLGCDVFDFGANHREIVNHAFDTYRALQPFWRYKRHSVARGWENYGNYVNRVFNTLMSADTPFRYYSIYQWWDLGAYTDDLRDASIDALNFYGEIFSMPEPGRFCPFGQNTNIDPFWFNGLENTYVPASWDSRRGECTGWIDIPQGPGQPFGFSWTDEYDYRIHRVGSFIDKAVASQMVFDINANFAFSSFFTDSRATNISYWTLFQSEFLSLVRGMMVGDYQGFGGVWENGKYVPNDVVDRVSFGRGLPSSQAGKPRIYTPASFNNQFNVLVGGMIFASGWQDRMVDFNQYVKVGASFKEGQELDETVVNLATFVHPETGQIYRAVQTHDGKSITVEMIDRANMLKERYLTARTNMENARGTDGFQAAHRIYRRRADQMEDTVARLDMIRFVWEALDASALR
jgi:hypothetical protein